MCEAVAREGHECFLNRVASATLRSLFVRAPQAFAGAPEACVAFCCEAPAGVAMADLDADAFCAFVFSGDAN